MEDSDIKFFENDLQLMSKASNYLDWQVRLIKPYLRGVQLEIGAGVGNFTKSLARDSISHIAIEPDIFCFKQLLQKTSDQDNVTVLNIRSEELPQETDLPSKFDSIVALNVLEHIEDDKEAICSWGKMLTQHGNIILLVPYGEWLYGAIDQRLHHHRRYSKQMVLELAKNAGFKIVHFNYINCLGMWAWYWNNKIAKRSHQNSQQIFIFDKLIVPWLSRLESLIPPPFGQSIFVVLGKDSKFNSHRFPN